MATCSLILLCASPSVPLNGHRGKVIWYIMLPQKSRPKSTSTIACNSDIVIGQTVQLPKNYLHLVL